MRMCSCRVRLERAGNDDLDDGVAIFADALRVGFERLLRLLESVAIPPTTETIYQLRLCLRCGAVEARDEPVSDERFEVDGAASDQVEREPVHVRAVPATRMINRHQKEEPVKGVTRAETRTGSCP